MPLHSVLGYVVVGLAALGFVLALMALISRGYVYEAVNDAYLSYHKRSRGDVVGRSVWEIEGYRMFEEMIQPQLDQALAGESVTYQAHFAFRGPGRRLMDVSYFPFYGKSGEVHGVVLNSRDITETRKLEDQLIQAQ